MDHNMDHDLSSIEELIEFDAACLAAKSECPQYEELSLINGYSVQSPFSIADIFRNHFNCKVLWSLGYHKGLSSKAKAAFKRYAVLRNGDVYDTKNKTIFKASDKMRLCTTFKTVSATSGR
jgi:hypothetical protein